MENKNFYNFLDKLQKNGTALAKTMEDIKTPHVGIDINDIMLIPTNDPVKESIEQSTDKIIENLNTNITNLICQLNKSNIQSEKLTKASNRLSIIMIILAFIQIYVAIIALI